MLYYEGAMEFRQLELFLAVIEESSVTRAAELTNPRLVIFKYFQHPWKVLGCQPSVAKFKFEPG